MKLRNSLLLIAILTLMAFAVTAFVPYGAGLAIGSKAPKTDVSMKNVNGEMISIADVKGEKGTLVIFSCNSCPWVKAWEERIAAIGNYAVENGIGVIMINPNDTTISPEDGYNEMIERAAKLGLEFPYVVDADSNVARAFDAKVTPEAYLFDEADLLVYHGTIDDNARKPAEIKNHFLKEALHAMMAGTAIEHQETKAIGCAVKFRPVAD